MQKICFLLLFVFPGLLCADIPYPHVRVSGNAVREVEPNELYWQVEVRSEGPTIEAVNGHHLPAVKNLLAYVKTFAVKGTVQTSSMSYGEHYEWQNNSRVKVGYYALTNINFTLDDLDRYDNMWSYMSRMRNVGIKNVGYGHSDENEIRMEVRDTALINARDKAVSMAKVLESRVGDVLLIEETSHHGAVRMESVFGDATPGKARAMMASPSAEGESALAPGMIRFSMQVQAAFRLHSVE